MKQNNYNNNNKNIRKQFGYEMECLEKREAIEMKRLFRMKRRPGRRAPARTKSSLARVQDLDGKYCIQNTIVSGSADKHFLF